MSLSEFKIGAQCRLSSIMKHSSALQSVIWAYGPNPNGHGNSLAKAGASISIHWDGPSSSLPWDGPSSSLPAIAKTCNAQYHKWRRHISLSLPNFQVFPVSLEKFSRPMRSELFSLRCRGHIHLLSSYRHRISRKSFSCSACRHFTGSQSSPAWLSCLWVS